MIGAHPPLDRVRGLILGLAWGEANGHGERVAASSATACAWAVGDVVARAASEPPDVLCASMHAALIAAIDADPAAEAPLRESARRLATGVPWTEAGLPWNKSADVVTRAAPIAVVFGPWPLLLREVTRMATVPTHGHPSALAAGLALATMLGEALAGHDPALWGDAARRAVSRSPCGEVLDALERAALAARIESDGGALDTVGQGYAADEALARAWAAVLRHPDDAARACTTACGGQPTGRVAGAVAGALWGAMHGAEALPSSSGKELTRRVELDALASRLLDARLRLR